MMLACGQEKVFLQTIYLAEFLKTLPPKRPFPCGIFFSSFKNVSKIKPKSAIFAFFLFFSLFAPPYFSFSFPPLVCFPGLSNAKTPVFWPFSIQKAAHLAGSLFKKYVFIVSIRINYKCQLKFVIQPF